jgi:cytochrome c553
MGGRFVKKRIDDTQSFLTLGALMLAIGSAACGSNSSPTSPTPTAPTLSQIQSQIFDSACVTCHTDVGRVPAASLNLRPGASFPNLVNVQSTGKPGAIRVRPGDANGSYLVQKLEGAADIVGARMPRNAAPLSDAQVKMIRDWINAGAPNN